MAYIPMRSDHIGPHTTQVPQCSREELLYDVVIRAIDHGWPIDWLKENMLERMRNEIDVGVAGRGHLKLSADRATLAELARRAVAWLNAQRDDGKRFVLSDDGLYLLDTDQPDSDASAVRYPFTWISAAATAAGHINPPAGRHR